MKKIIMIWTILMATTMTMVTYSHAGEAKGSNMSAIGKVLMGNHKLMKMNSSATPYFIISGGDTKASIIFSWETNDGSYALSSLSTGKVRVRIDEKQEIPTIKFRWSTYPNSTSTDSLMTHNIIYAVVTCKQSDWVIRDHSTPKQDVKAVKKELAETKAKPQSPLSKDVTKKVTWGSPNSMEDNPKWKYIEESFKKK